jgi:hypothetical protein
MIVVTWNMQGAQASDGNGKKRKKLEGTNISDALNLLSLGVDALLLQEVGGYPEGWKLKPVNLANKVILHCEVVNLGTKRHASEVFVVWYDGKANGMATHDRCNMAVISKSHTATYSAVTHPNSPSLRPLVGLETAKGLWLYSIHAPSGNHNAAAGVANSLLGEIDPNKKWLCGGDYNCSPQDMKGKGWAPVASDYQTHQSGNTLDFAIGKGCSVTLLAADKITMVSDHYSQCFEVQ